MRKVLYVIVMTALISVFCFSVYKIYTIYSEYKQGEDTYDNLAGEVYEEESGDADVKNMKPKELKINVNFPKLKKVNPDVIGWIYNPGTVINYPVVQGKDNSYYLKHLIDGKYNASGTPFLDFNMSPDFSDKNMFVYGHHMKNGSMFSSITEYKNKSYYNKHKNMYLLTPAGNYRLEIFSAYITEASSDTYMRGFGEDDKFQEYINYVKNKSLIKTDVYPTLKDQVLSLSTCTYEYEDARFVVHTRMVKLVE